MGNVFCAPLRWAVSGSGGKEEEAGRVFGVEGAARVTGWEAIKGTEALGSGKGTKEDDPEEEPVLKAEPALKEEEPEDACSCAARWGGRGGGGGGLR